MLIGIISDTHENVPAIERAVAILAARKPGIVIHCGDIISPPVLPHFKPLPMRFVFGNNDGEREGLRMKALELGFDEISDELELNFNGRKVYVYHGTKAKHLEERASSEAFDYVLCGHTHALRDERRGRTRIINPGALFKAAEYTVALLDPHSDTLEILKVPKQDGP